MCCHTFATWHYNTSAISIYRNSLICLNALAYINTQVIKSFLCIDIFIDTFNHILINAYINHIHNNNCST